MASDGIESKMPGAHLGPGVVRDFADETATDLIELTGVIKWFDVSKGFGFIVPDNGMPDVLLHVTCLRRDGYQTAYEGARIVCEAVNAKRAFKRSASSRWMNRRRFTRPRCRRRAPMSP